MKKSTIIILALVIAGYAFYSFYLVYREYLPLKVDDYRVLIIYNRADQHKTSYDIDSYLSVLTEEGVPCESAEIAKLIKTPAKQMAKNVPAIIFPDSLLQHIPEESVKWVKEYLNNGGNLAVIYDVGVKKGQGGDVYLDQALLSDIVGFNYVTFNKYEDKSYTNGQIKFKNKAAADLFEIPPGKLSDNLVLSGYFYGDISYPVARTQNITAEFPGIVFAQALTTEGEVYPTIVLKKYGQGNVLYVNMPLGYLKASSDDLPLRAFLRTFLFHIIKIPHLVNTNQGKGKMVINWHVDSNGEWKSIPSIIGNKYLDQALRSSIHIAAGDFLDKPGDGFGFDACGGGKTYVQKYLPYGVIGAHGGWGLNWFARKLEKNKLWKYEIRRHIKKNKRCLEYITGYVVAEYSAPLGVHPQTVTTKVLENMGFNSYYFTGDGGSAPNRTFSDGKMVSDKVIAFPMSPYGKFASLDEMKKAGITGKDVQKWLRELADYVIEKRTTRIFNSNLDDIFEYPQAVGNFLQYLKLKQASGELQVEPMSEIAKFFLRFIKTQYTFRNQENGLSVILKNPEGLYGITVAIPRGMYRVDEARNMIKSEDKYYYYLTVGEDVKEKNIMAHRS